MIIDGETNWGVSSPLPAAKGFGIKGSPKSIYEWVRQLRGGVLAGAFTFDGTNVHDLNLKDNH